MLLRANPAFNLEKPIIEAVNGVAMGGGFETVLACDIVFASEISKFSLPKVKVGLIVVAGGIPRLGRYIGQFALKK